MRVGVLIIIGALFFSASAFAGGGDIASAPQMPIGQPVTDGATCSYNPSTGVNTCTWADAPPSMWRILAQAGDRLTLDYEDLSTESGLWPCLLAPSITDYTLNGDGDCSDGTGYGIGLNIGPSQKHELNYVFPTSGNWTVVFGGYESHSTSYGFTAYLRHRTALTVRIPRLVKRSTRVTVRGTVTGGATGNIALQSRSLKQAAWKTFGVAAIGASGTFRFATKVSGPGTYRIKVVYPGDDSHLPSTAIVSFKVV